MCPVVLFERAEGDYAERVSEWIANPHAYFKSFGPEARTFPKKHPSERLRTMTLYIHFRQWVRWWLTSARTRVVIGS